MMEMDRRELLINSWLAVASSMFPFVLRDNEPQFIKIDLTNTIRIEYDNLTFLKDKKLDGVFLFHNFGPHGYFHIPLEKKQFDKKEFYESVCRQAKHRHRFFEIVDGDKSNLYAEYI